MINIKVLFSTERKLMVMMLEDKDRGQKVLCKFLNKLCKLCKIDKKLLHHLHWDLPQPTQDSKWSLIKKLHHSWQKQLKIQMPLISFPVLSIHNQITRVLKNSMVASKDLVKLLPQDALLFQILVLMNKLIVLWLNLSTTLKEIKFNMDGACLHIEKI
jgi:hypothetical protein